jgi:hypothetical protein
MTMGPGLPFGQATHNRKPNFRRWSGRRGVEWPSQIERFGYPNEFDATVVGLTLRGVVG